MNPVPEVQPLSQGHRRYVFLFSVLIFIVTVPTFVFYATGYRFDFSGEENAIRSVGGMYVSAAADGTEIYIDDEPVENMRIFQRAAYIQNMTEGAHQVHVQGEGLHTWVKELPVFAHYVTEVSSFNMPLQPQVRLVSEYVLAEGSPVLFESATSTPLGSASSTQSFFVSTTTATSSYDLNPEYPYIETQFASSSEERTQMMEQKQILSEPFGFSDDRAMATATMATTTKEYRDTKLYEFEGEVYIAWEGDAQDVPYYYCVRHESGSSTAALYGEHVEQHIATAYAAEGYMAPTETETRYERYCRDHIRIDRKWQEVLWFDYFPGSRDLVLMHLSDGLYVVEVDDRSWQNTQLLYPGEGIVVLRDGERIFVQDDGYFLEVFTELLETN